MVSCYIFNKFFLVSISSYTFICQLYVKKLLTLHLPFLWHEIDESLQDLVVGYMGVPKYAGISMTEHPQYITVR